MIKHIVMSRHKEGSSDADISHLKDKPDRLKNKIPEVVVPETVLKISRNFHSFDPILVPEFRHEEARECYELHPDHQEAFTLICQTVGQVKVDDNSF